jgi:NADH-quinone oxidoreductase subunit E
VITENKTIHLSASVREKIDKWMQRYPADQKRSAVLSALHFAQEDNGGWLSEPVMDAVAEYLELPKIAVYEVATFYTMYNLEPTGKHVINVCTNVSCMLADSKKIVDHLKNRLNVNVNETSADGKFTLREVECLAACAGAPMFHIGKKYYEHLTPEKVDAILNELE